MDDHTTIMVEGTTMVDTIEVDTTTIMDADIEVVTTITTDTDIIMVVVTEHSLGDMVTIEIKMNITDIEKIHEHEILKIEIPILETNLDIVEITIPEIQDHITELQLIDKIIIEIHTLVHHKDQEQDKDR